MTWGYPSLERVRNAVVAHGKKATPIQGNSFRCQCPAHDGDGMSAVFKLQPSGKISYTCHSHGCDLKLLMNVLDLVHSDFYPPELNPMKLTYPEKSFDEHFIVHAEDAIEHGKPISDEDLEKYKQALLFKAGLAA